MSFDPCITLSPRNYNALYRIISRLSFSLDPGGVSRCVPRRPGGVHLYALHRGNVAAACGVAVYIRGGLVFFSRPKRRTCGEWQRLYILLYSVAYNIYNILVRNGIYKICTFCDLQTNGRFARKQKARGGVYVGGRASGGVRCVALVCGACGYQRGASIHTGWAPPP